MTHAFEIVEIPASGTYGTLCVARPGGEDRLVAVKVLRKDQLSDSKVLRRFRDEARLLHRMRHPNIVSVEALLDIQGHPVVVMEYIDGVSLEQLMRSHRRGLEPAIAFSLIQLACRAIDAAFNQAVGTNSQPIRVIHRDIKPSNMLLSREGVLKVVDFGIAKAEFDEREAVTQSMILGSLGFIAPEVHAGDTATHFIDVYALGISLIFLLTGKAPVLPRHPERHDAKLERLLGHVAPEGLSEPVIERLHLLIRGMCAGNAARRMESSRAAHHLGLLLQMIGGTPDLKAFAAEHVAPLADARKRVPPKSTADYEQVAFIEHGLDHAVDLLVPGNTPAPVPRAKSDLKAFLASPGWERRLGELQRLVESSADYPPKPILAILHRANRPWWKIWEVDAPEDQVLAVLQVLSRRPTKRVVAYARTLVGHENPRIAHRARRILEATA